APAATPGSCPAASPQSKSSRHSAGEPAAGLAAQGEADVPMGPGHPGGRTGRGREDIGQPLAEDAPRAAGADAAGLADDQAGGDGPALGGEISDGPSVAAVDAVRRRPALGTDGGRGGGGEKGDGGRRSQDEVIEAQAGAREE